MRAMASSGDPLRGLPASFTRAQARRAGLTDRELYRLRDDDMIEALGYGHFRRNRRRCFRGPRPVGDRATCPSVNVVPDHSAGSARLDG